MQTEVKEESNVGKYTNAMSTNPERYCRRKSRARVEPKEKKKPTPACKELSII